MSLHNRQVPSTNWATACRAAASHMGAGGWRPTDVCDAGIADKLGIPAAYLRKTRRLLTRRCSTRT